MRLSEFVNKNRSILLFIVFVMSFALRVAITYREYSINSMSKWSDALLYMEYGKSIASGVTCSEINSKYKVVGPVIPSIVALSVLLTGDSVWPVLIFNCLLSALLIYAMYEIGKRLVGVKAGYLLALWSAFNFSFIGFNSQILKEPLIFIILPLIVICLVNILKKHRVTINIIVSSLLFSLLIHTDERFFLYLPVFVVYIFLALAEKKLKRTALWILILFVTMVPLTLCNYKQFGDLVILTPRTTAITSKLWGEDIVNLHFSSDAAQEKAIIKRSHSAAQAELIYGIPPRPYGRIEKYYRAFIHYWQPTYFKLHYIQYGYRPVKWTLMHNFISIVFYGMFIPFFLAGIILSLLKKDWLILFLGILPMIHGLIHTILIWPLERYRLPYNFLIVLVAIWFIKNIVEYFKNKELSVVRNATPIT